MLPNSLSTSTSDPNMPMMLEGLPTSAMGTMWSLQSNLDDMTASCGALAKHITLMNEDKENFGLLSEEIYFYHAPDVLTHLTKISRVAAMCTRVIDLDEETNEINEQQLTLILYNLISEHKRMLKQLASLGSLMRSTGSLFDALGDALQRQQIVFHRFWQALEAKYVFVRIRSASDWTDELEAMRSCVAAYPDPLLDGYDSSDVPDSP